MPSLDRAALSDLRGLLRMTGDATNGLVGLVESMHRTIQLRPGPLGNAVEGATGGITGLVYRSISGAVRLAVWGLDAGLAPLDGLLPDAAPTSARAPFLAVINGVYGDYLARTANPLAIDMSLRHAGRPVDPDDPAEALRDQQEPPSETLLVLVHGLCLNELSWGRQEHDHGAALASEFGYTPLYLRYNSGLSVADNGRNFAAILERVIANWPRAVKELVMIGHSMGGLVVRAACRHAGEAGHGWPGIMRKLVFLGTPHHGAPLERGGHRLDTIFRLSPYGAPFTRIGRMRSAGITDLRHGSIMNDPEQFVPLPSGVTCYAAAARLGTRLGRIGDRLVGDGLVPLDSALGRHSRADRTLAIPSQRQWIGSEMGHLDLLSKPEVYARLRAWMAGEYH